MSRFANFLVNLYIFCDEIDFFPVNFSAVYNNTVIPYSVYQKWEQVGPLSVRTLAAVESKLATLHPLDTEELLRVNFTPMYLLIQASLMMNRHAFKYSFLAEIMTRALTMTPGDNNPKDVETLREVMMSKSLSLTQSRPLGHSFQHERPLD